MLSWQNAQNSSRSCYAQVSHLKQKQKFYLKKFYSRIAPIMKVSNCRSYGAIVLVEGTNMSEAKSFALKLSKMLNLNYINGYDHPNILAGQGTMALEIIEAVPDVDAIIVPTGGAGLLAGIAVAAKSMNPDIMIRVREIQI